MENKINILANTLEQMLADCEDNGRDGIQPMLTPDDVALIIKALNHYEDLCQSCVNVAAQTCGAFTDIYQTNCVEGMLSSDYKERFKAEYQQTKIRYEKLKAFNNKIEAARRTTCEPFVSYAKRVDEPKHDCPEEMLRNQQSIMGEYLHILEVRAVVEGIEL
jgi:hypothetical protein